MYRIVDRPAYRKIFFPIDGGVMNNKGLNGIKVKKGSPEKLGAWKCGDSCYFAAAFPEDQKAELIITDAEGKKLTEIPLPEEERTGRVSAVQVEGLDEKAAGYYYRVGGRKRVLDPHAKLIRRDYCLLEQEAPSWDGDRSPGLSPDNMMIYKLHVRGFTKKAKIAQGIRGTFSGVAKMLPYITGLGFNAIELMPAYEWVNDLRITPFSAVKDESEGPAKAVRPVNYWGYADQNYYFAPRWEYCATDHPSEEFSSLVRACHDAGTELYMEMYFPDGTYPALALEAVRYWKMHYHVDGFHLIGGGVPAEMIVGDPLLASTKLMFEYVDTGRLFRGTVPKKRNIIICNDDFEHTGRALLKGDEGQTGRFAAHVRSNPPDCGVVNYMANVNGFTLYDTVSYDWKHNEENGEDNRDGTALNFSWNCGAEGPSRKKAVKDLRMRQVRNALMYVFLSQGIPLLYAGDEQLNTQKGNNNAYCCDNSTGWTDWNSSKDASELTAFVRKLTEFRKNHKIFHMPGELKGTDYRSYGIPDISFHNDKAWVCSFENISRTLAVMYNGLYTQEESQDGGQYYYVLYNAYWNPFTFALPALPKGCSWFLRADTSKSDPFLEEPERLEDQKFFEAGERTVCILEGRPDGNDNKEDLKKDGKTKEDRSGGTSEDDHPASSSGMRVLPEGGTDPAGADA